MFGLTDDGPAVQGAIVRLVKGPLYPSVTFFALPGGRVMGYWQA